MAERVAENARNYKGEKIFSTYCVTVHIIECADRSGGNQFHSVKKNQNGQSGVNLPDQDRPIDPNRLVYFQKALSIFQNLKQKEKEIETLSQINIEYFITNYC